MKDDKKKKKQTPKKAVSKKPAAKKAPKATTAKKKTTAAPKKAAAKKPVAKAKKQTKAATPKRASTPKSKAIKPDWDFENEKPKKGKAKKEEIIINIPRKPAPQAKQPKSVTKQVTEQLPDSAKLKTIHLHFRID